MARRYSRILSAARYYAAIDNYIKYITDATKRGGNVGNGTPRPESVRLYVTPFSISLDAQEFAITSASKPSYDLYKSDLGTNTRDTVTNPDETYRFEGYSAARLIIKTGKSATGVKKTSKVTGMPYLSYGGKSTSVPFGKAAETDEQQGVFKDLQAKIVARTSGAIVTLKPEKF